MKLSSRPVYYAAVGFLLMGLAFTLGLLRKPNPSCHLRIYSYGSFISSLGPGPRLAEKFEHNFHCHVDFVNTGDGGLLIQKVKMENVQHADVILGLDQLQLQAARQQLGLEKVNEQVPWAIDGWNEPDFLPYDYSPLTFLYHRGDASPPSRFSDLLKPSLKAKISFQNPRTSTPGLQWLNWLRASLGSQNVVAFLRKLEPQVLVWAPSWSESYGLFMKKQALLTFGYLTSLVYHWQEEKTDEVQAAIFEEPHPFQIEYSAVVSGCENCPMAHKFLHMLVSEEGQKIIMDRHYMLPIRKNMIANTLYEKLPKLKLMSPHQNRLGQQSAQELVTMWKQSQ
jgi:thiamine transport system substrate-binding protein